MTEGKIRGFRQNGVYIVKGVPYGAWTAAPNTSCRQSSLNRGRKFVTPRRRLQFVPRYRFLLLRSETQIDWLLFDYGATACEFVFSPFS